VVAERDESEPDLVHRDVGGCGYLVADPANSLCCSLDVWALAARGILQKYYIPE
jgi:hypothetical protein